VGGKQKKLEKTWLAGQTANKTVLTQFQGPIQLRSAHETVIYIAFHLLTVAMGLRLKIAQTLVMVRGF